MKTINLHQSTFVHLAALITFLIALAVSTDCLARDKEAIVCTGSCNNTAHPERIMRQSAKDRGIGTLQWRRDMDCLTLVGFAEARGNGSEAMEAVMWVVQNRRIASEGKKDVCDVISQRGAFEGVTKPRFRSQFAAIRRGQQLPRINTLNVIEEKAVRDARRLASSIVSKERTHDLTRGATHFYAPVAQRQMNRQAPNWAKEFQQTASIGGHEFFREN